MIEILILNLKPGTGKEFLRAYESLSLPLLKKWRFNVVSYGQSLHDENSFYVVRAFTSLEDRQSSEDAFYGSDDWRKGPRETILGMVESMATVVVSPENLEHWTPKI